MTKHGAALRDQPGTPSQRTVRKEGGSDGSELLMEARREGPAGLMCSELARSRARRRHASGKTGSSGTSGVWSQAARFKSRFPHFLAV